MELQNSHSRSVLNEGRVWGVGFAFCKRINSNTFQTIQPLSTCKDYLNDIIYNERTGLPISAHGLKLTDKSGIFNKKLKAFMSISLLKSKNNDYYTYNKFRSYEKDLELFNNSYNNMMIFMNKVEQSLGIKIPTSIEKIGDNSLLVKFSKKWCSTSYMISLYSLLLRSSIYYDGEEDIMSYLASNESTVLSDDMSALKVFREEMFNKMIVDQATLCGLLNQNFEEYKGSPYAIHSQGFYSFYFKNKSKLNANT